MTVLVSPVTHLYVTSLAVGRTTGRQLTSPVNPPSPSSLLMPVSGRHARSSATRMAVFRNLRVSAGVQEIVVLPTSPSGRATRVWTSPSRSFGASCPAPSAKPQRSSNWVSPPDPAPQAGVESFDGGRHGAFGLLPCRPVLGEAVVGRSGVDVPVIALCWSLMCPVARPD